MSEPTLRAMQEELILLVEDSAAFFLMPEKKEEMIEAINEAPDTPASRKLLAGLIEFFREEREYMMAAIQEELKRKPST